MKVFGFACAVLVSALGQFHSGVLNALARKQLLLTHTADWLGFNSQQRELQYKANSMSQPSSGKLGNSPLEKLEASLDANQRQFLFRFCVRQEGMNALLDPDVQSILKTTPSQTKALSRVFQQHPSPTGTGPGSVLDIRLLSSQLQARINGIQARHDAEVQQWSGAKKILNASQIRAMRDYLAFPLLEPGILPASMRDLITRTYVQDEIGMSTADRRSLHDARHRRTPAPGQTRVLDFYAPERDAIRRLRSQQRERLQQIALQSNLNLVASLEIIQQLQLTFEQQAEFNLKNDILGMHRSLEVAAGMSARLPIMPPPPSDPNAAAIKKQMDERARDELTKARNSAVRFEAEREAIIDSVLTPAQRAKWRSMLGRPFPPAVH